MLSTSCSSNSPPSSRDTKSASNIMATSPISTTSSLASKRSTTPSSMSLAHWAHYPFLFLALPSISARLVFAALSKHFFVLVFRFLRRAQNTHGTKRPVFSPPLSLRRCVFVRVLPAFYESLVTMPFTSQGGRESIWDASCPTEPNRARSQGSPK